jgi:hypothetical protein
MPLEWGGYSLPSIVEHTAGQRRTRLGHGDYVVPGRLRARAHTRPSGAARPSGQAGFPLGTWPYMQRLGGTGPPRYAGRTRNGRPSGSRALHPTPLHQPGIATLALAPQALAPQAGAGRRRRSLSPCDVLSASFLSFECVASGLVAWRESRMFFWRGHRRGVRRRSLV